ncbi:MAG: hypothetical protein ACRYHQ_02980 [Janthinobacterium lividum]
MTKRGSVAAKGSVAELNAFLDQNGMGGRGRRSPLSRWLRANHDEFAATLVAREPGWDEVARGLSAMGLLDGNGKPPTGDRVRKVWWETRRDKLATEAALQERSQPRIAGRNAPPVHVFPEAGSAGDRSSPRSEKVADAHPIPQPHLVGLADGGVVDCAPAPGQAAPVSDGDEQIRRARELLGRGTVPIPGSVR